VSHGKFAPGKSQRTAELRSLLPAATMIIRPIASGSRPRSWRRSPADEHGRRCLVGSAVGHFRDLHREVQMSGRGGLETSPLPRTPGAPRVSVAEPLSWRTASAQQCDRRRLASALAWLHHAPCRAPAGIGEGKTAECSYGIACFCSFGQKLKMQPKPLKTWPFLRKE